jgi:hypothetical protein
MWAGSEIALIAYSAVICREWRRRGFRDTLHQQFMAAYTRERGDLIVPYPSWFRSKRFHSSHRSNLLRKDYNHYSRFGWTESIDLPYHWPVSDVVVNV